MSKVRGIWRGLDEYTSTQAADERAYREFPEGASELESDGVTRRRFMGLMGASAALAGAAMTGCVRKPVQKIMPHAKRPEDLVPGKPVYFRTACNVGERVIGLHVESQDGRPTKIEGNPNHPMSLGATDAWAQASLLNLYDRSRSKVPHTKGKASTWAAFAKAFTEKVAAIAGAKVAILTEATPSPTLERLLKASGATIYVHDPAFNRNEVRGIARATGQRDARLLYDFAQAEVLASFDADFLGVDGDAVRNSKGFSRNRLKDGSMSRLYVVESSVTVTGMAADERLTVSSAQVGGALRALAAAVGVPGVESGLSEADPSNAWVQAMAKDLKATGGKAAVFVGERHPEWAHALCLAINQTLGSVTKDPTRQPAPIALVSGALPLRPGLDALIQSIGAGKVDALVMLGTNPVFTAPTDWRFADALRKVPVSVHLSDRVDETSQIATWHVPRAHFLESWGDLRATDGTASIVQPLIAPLFNAISDIELMNAMVDARARGALAEIDARDGGYAAVRATWSAVGVLPERSESNWRKTLFKGTIEYNAARHFPVDLTADPRRRGMPRRIYGVTAVTNVTEIAARAPKGTVKAASSSEMEIVFVRDPSVLDGRYANNGWLQEMPDPVTKLTWDNALYVSPTTAEALGVISSFEGSVYKGDQVTVSVGNATLTMAVMVVPGMPDWVCSVGIGYGRASAGEIAQGAGFAVSKLRTSEGFYAASPVKVAKGAGRYPLATTQEHWSLRPPALVSEHPEPNRDMVRTQYFNLGEHAYAKEPNYLRGKHEEIVTHMVEGYKLFDLPQPRGENWFREGQQWAMVIDLNRCTGCSACLVACNAENNVPIVGKEQVLNGREMHWIRIDRYFLGADYTKPGQIASQPVMCQHCETAPCETVCPVAATQHSDTGMNDMAYNRCIGTRYCANNCPYKVRRFNFFNYQKENHEHNPLMKMMRNPDVSVRFRGVMEKCSFCVQRTTEARINAKEKVELMRRSGEISGEEAALKGKIFELAADVQTACQQACPSEAIVFGDILHPSETFKARRESGRYYEMLAELATRPRVSYLGRLRNRNPDIAQADGDDGNEEHH